MKTLEAWTFHDSRELIAFLTRLVENQKVKSGVKLLRVESQLGNIMLLNL